MTDRLVVIVVSALAACHGPSPGETEGATSTSSTGASTMGASSTSAGGTAAPTTSTQTSGTSGLKLDLPSEKLDVMPEPPALGLVGCALDAVPGTALAGPSKFGPFMADRAYFGMFWVGPWLRPTLLFLSPGADPAIEVAAFDTHGATGMVMHGEVMVEDATRPGGLFGTWSSDLLVWNGRSADWPGPVVEVTLTGQAGNWDVFDPSDPPRLLGTVNGPIAGPFEAVYCDKVGGSTIPE